MPSRQDEQVPARSGSSSFLMSAGLLLAAAATVAAFLTDDPVRLRLAVVAAAWGVVIASLSATRRRAEQQAALAREAEVRRAYERELDLEAAARREFELELEHDLRQDTEEAVRREIGELRADIATLDRVRQELSRSSELADDLSALTALRAEVASLAALRADVASLSSLRTDVAALASLRGDVAALGALRDDLGQLADLRADMSRLRSEIVEQLDGEMLVERIVMRTQATRRPADWTDGPHELPRDRPSFRLEEPAPATREYEYIRPVRSADHSLAGTDGGPDAGLPRHSAAAPELWSQAPAAAEADIPHRPGSTAENVVAPPRPMPYRRRRSDDESDGPRTDPAEALTAERPRAAPARPLLPIDTAPAGENGPGTDGHTRLTEILAENGGGPPSGRGRRRRYREDGEPDDVLSRVLGDR